MKGLSFGKLASIIVLFCTTTAAVSSAQTLTTLFSFDGATGADAGFYITQGIDGNFYGVTVYGGNGGCTQGCGTAFGITPEGNLTSTVRFEINSGHSPVGGMLQSTNRNFYGTTYYGGTYEDGTIFELTPKGTLSTLHDFDLTDGSAPNGPLIEGLDGAMYGTTFGQGGSNGSIFKITPAGTLTLLHTFCAQDFPHCPGGARPQGGLLLAPNGNFYGVTSTGGITTNCKIETDACGTVFELTPAGKLTVLYSFCSQKNCPDGSYPVGGVVQGPNGNFYGTTYWGGANPCIQVSIDYGCGTVFEITPEGQLTTLHSFCSEQYCGDGQWPDETLVLGADGNFYGTTSNGGSMSCVGGGSGCGTIFRITPDGAFTTLYNFTGPDGGEPDGLVQSTNGMFYGTTSEGGAYACVLHTLDFGCGTFFSFNVGLGPFVEPKLNFGSVGSKVEILGTNLTGATGVTFNGTSATFRVVSSTYIEAEVPSGATTGTIEVATPGGKLNSNVAFQVLP